MKNMCYHREMHREMSGTRYNRSNYKFISVIEYSRKTINEMNHVTTNSFRLYGHCFNVDKLMAAASLNAKTVYIIKTVCKKLFKYIFCSKLLSGKTLKFKEKPKFVVFLKMLKWDSTKISAPSLQFFCLTKYLYI